MSVADLNNHRIYHFELNQNRTALLLHGPLVGKVANSNEKLHNVIFAAGFSGAVTDLESGRDGFLYILYQMKGRYRE
jgi:hypothetical protein